MTSPPGAGDKQRDVQPLAPHRASASGDSDERKPLAPPSKRLPMWYPRLAESRVPIHEHDWAEVHMEGRALVQRCEYPRCPAWRVVGDAR